MTETRFDGRVAPIAIATRSELEESVHQGAGVAVDATGAVIASIGDPELVVYPRSALKPLQADAMVELGLDLSAELLALVCASHSGDPVHLAGVRRILEGHGLAVEQLQNTPELPYGSSARADARRAGVEPSPLQQNCSGKHAGMLATCTINGWSTEDYLAVDHPLQTAITARLVEAIGGSGGRSIHVGVDGCGAPTHTLTLRELALAFAAVVGRPVAAAMNAFPVMAGGEGRDVTVWMAAVPGSIVKDGASGVMAAATADGRAAAFKVADGSGIARQAVTVEMMRHLGVGHDVVESVADDVAVPVLGHGRPVGELRAVPWTVWAGAT